MELKTNWKWNEKLTEWNFFKKEGLFLHKQMFMMVSSLTRLICCEQKHTERFSNKYWLHVPICRCFIVVFACLDPWKMLQMEKQIHQIIFVDKYTRSNFIRTKNTYFFILKKPLTSVFELSWFTIWTNALVVVSKWMRKPTDPVSKRFKSFAIWSSWMRPPRSCSSNCKKYCVQSTSLLSEFSWSSTRNTYRSKTFSSVREPNNPNSFW